MEETNRSFETEQPESPILFCSILVSNVRDRTDIRQGRLLQVLFFGGMDAKNASDCAKASEGGDAPMVLSWEPQTFDDLQSDACNTAL